MNPTQAHDIVNPEINPLIKKYQREETRSVVGDLYVYYKGKLKGIISAQEREILDIEQDIKDLQKARIEIEVNEDVVYEILTNIIIKKIAKLKALKISTAHLKEVVK